MNNHTLIVRAGGRTTLDGQDIVTTFPATFSNEMVRLRYFKNHVFQQLTDVPKLQWRHTGSGYVLQTMQIDLPQRTSLTVNVNTIGSPGTALFVEFLDIFISLPIPASGTDGHCGKADGDMSDDTTASFLGKLSQFRVSPEERLFDQDVALLEDKQRGTFIDGECLSGTRSDAVHICRAAMPVGGSPDWLDACVDDVCAAGEVMANRTVIFAAQTEGVLVEEAVAAQESTSTAMSTAMPSSTTSAAVSTTSSSTTTTQAPEACRTCIPGDPCFGDVSWAMTEGIPQGRYYGQDLSPQIDEYSCFEEVQAALGQWQHDPQFSKSGMREQNFPDPCEAESEPRTKYGLPFCR